MRRLRRELQAFGWRCRRHRRRLRFGSRRRWLRALVVRIQKEEAHLISDKATQLVYRTIGGKQPLIAYCTYGDVNMSLDKKSNILLILTSLAFGLLLLIVIVSAFIPHDWAMLFNMPWFIWASILDMVAYVVSITVMHLVTKPKIIK